MPKNMANHLTIGRVLMIPVFLVLMYVDFPGSRYWALGVYIVACLTDFADGYIARHYNQVSDFGKFMDPLADKCLVMAALCCFVEQGDMLAWIWPSCWCVSSPCPACVLWRWKRAVSLPPGGRARSKPPPPWCASA